MQITIVDEGTRRAVLFSIWKRAYDAFADGTHAFHDEARLAIEKDDGWRTAGPDVESLRATFRGADRVRAAACGESVELEIPPDELRVGIEGCVDHLRESERFWDAEPAERARQLETHDAACHLLQTLTIADVVA